MYRSVHDPRDYHRSMEKPRKTTNSRGERSRQEILNAASRVMSAYGYAGTSMSTLVNATGIPKSAIYHHFGSKAGLLADVMAQGASGFFAAMQEAHRDPPEAGTPRDRLLWYLKKSGEVFRFRENFLRLMLIMVMSNEAAEPEALQMVIKVRNEGRSYMRKLVRDAFSVSGETLASDIVDDIAHFGMRHLRYAGSAPPGDVLNPRLSRRHWRGGAPRRVARAQECA
ncbi:TetR/AcrR family transcriptional regulator [Paraburkholderia sp. EG304]|uniref:TetR/AcrR family transcriptional regulator n=1 Tax=Paraburkholderia sp. EG304 TaxID=3237015 RepID=UPI00397A243A